VLALLLAGLAARTNGPVSAGEHHFAVDGVPIAYEVQGHGPLCIAHPAMGMDRSYLRSPIFEARFTMVYFDPIGTGASGHLRPGQLYSIERDVQVLDALRTYLGARSVCFIGHGSGGWVVQRYAVEHPDAVSALVLYATSPTTNDDWVDSVNATIASHRNESWFSAAIEGMQEETTAEDEASYLRALAKEAPLVFPGWSEHREAYIRALGPAKLSLEVLRHREGRPFDLRADLTRVTAPTLVITGDRDLLGGPEPSRWIANAIAGATLEVIHDAGVLAHIEQCHAFEDALDAFTGRWLRVEGRHP
jgi:proline iminopeptidase